MKVALAFASIYLIWGSTYLAIRFAIETLPPLLMASIRFFVAGALLYGWVVFRGEARKPTRREWEVSLLLGTLFFLGGNGGVSWAEQRVPSGLAALLVATIPFWIVLIEWIRKRGKRPRARVIFGVVAGFAGVALLVGPRRGGGAVVDPLGAVVLMVATICWASGSVFSRHLPQPRSHLQSGAMQMLGGSLALAAGGLVTGEAGRIDAGAVSTRSLLALLYLIGAGSIVGFSAYNWLLRATSPERVGTYAFVNPVIAVLLGWGLAGETVGPTVLLAGAVIVTGVFLIVSTQRRATRSDIDAMSAEGRRSRPDGPANDDSKSSERAVS